MKASAAVGAQMVAIFFTVVGIFTAAWALPSWVPVLLGMVAFFFQMLAMTYLVPAATGELDAQREAQR